MVTLDPRKWFKGDRSLKDLTNQIQAHQIIAATQKPYTEEELKRAIGVDSLLISDENVDDLLRALTYRELTDKEGKVVGKFVDFDFASLMIINSRLTRTSYIDEKESIILKLRIKRIINRIKIGMAEPQLDLGFASFLGALEIYFMALIDDAIGGKRGRLIKTMPRVIETKISTEKGGR